MTVNATGPIGPSGERADVLIVGAGPSGAVAAKRLAEAGMRVVCLEQGEWPDRTQFRGSEDDWELTSRKQWHWNPNVRELAQDYPIDLSGTDVTIANFNGVGGSATLYGAIWPRMTPANFRSASESGFAADWPLSYEELVPYYERTDRDFAVSGLGGNPAYPPGADPPQPALPINEGGLRLARAHARLGWHWWPETNAILSRAHEGRHPCVQRGTCYSGCNEGAKASPDLTHWRHLAGRGVELVTGARVRALIMDDRGLVAGAEWYDRDGVAHLQEADVVILAANAIGTARLLLASASDRYRDGLANSSGLVGRNLLLHSWGIATGVFEEQLESWQGHSGSWIGSWQFYESDERRGFVGTSKWMTQPTYGPLAQVLPAPGFGVWGPDHHRRLEELLGRSVTWAMTCDDLPSEDNRVELSTTMTDSSGFPAPKLTYAICDNTKALLAWHVQRATESLLEAGATRVEATDLVPMSAHLYGTARMGNDPATSVVNRFGIAHDIANLAIVDGSVFVTNGGVNPTSTIAALALRTAEHLATRHGDVPRPERNRSFSFADASRTMAMPSATIRGIEPAEPFDASERARLAGLADELIPATGDRPAPSAVGVAQGLLDRVLEARPDLGEPLRRALAVPHCDAASLQSQLAESDPEARDALELVVAGAYYLSPEVRKAIGYPGQVARTLSGDSFPAYVEEGLLDHMLRA